MQNDINFKVNRLGVKYVFFSLFYVSHFFFLTYLAFSSTKSTKRMDELQSQRTEN